MKFQKVQYVQMIELAKDKKIDKKDKKLHQHYLSTYDYPNGNKIIKLVGEEEFKLEQSINDKNDDKRTLRV